VQWTGLRRQQFEAWASAHDLDVASDQANLGFLLEELRGSQSHSLEQIRKTTDLEAAVFTFGEYFERPGGTTPTHLPADEERLGWAKRALAGALGVPQTPAPPPVPSAPAAPPPVSAGIGLGAGAPATAALASVLMWLSHWPIQPLDGQTALSLAGLLLGAFGLVIHIRSQ
jgi:hypothetical protein